MSGLGIVFKKDKYKKARGGRSRLLDISCPDCGTHICYYQKDGPGLLKRMYLDRIFDSKYSGLENSDIKSLPQFICPKCERYLGVPDIYKKENRLVYRLFVGAINKKLIKL